MGEGQNRRQKPSKGGSYCWFRSADRLIRFLRTLACDSPTKGALHCRGRSPRNSSIPACFLWAHASGRSVRDGEDDAVGSPHSAAASRSCVGPLVLRRLKFLWLVCTRAPALARLDLHGFTLMRARKAKYVKLCFHLFHTDRSPLYLLSLKQY